MLDEAFGELVDALGDIVQPVELGARFDQAIDLHGTVMAVEMAHNFRRDSRRAAMC